MTSTAIPADYAPAASLPDLTDAQYDLADSITAWVEAHPGMHAASRIARGVKAETTATRTVLDWMVASVMLASTGNGAWTNYGARS